MQSKLNRLLNCRVRRLLKSAVKKKKSLQMSEVSPIRNVGSPPIGFQRRHRDERSGYFDHSKENRSQKTSRKRYGKGKSESRLKKISKKEKLARQRQENIWDENVWADMTEPKLKTQRKKRTKLQGWKTNSHTYKNNQFANLQTRIFLQ